MYSPKVSTPPPSYALEVKTFHNSSIPRLHWDSTATERAVVGGKQLLSDLMAAVGQEHIILAKETSNHTPFGDGAEVNAMMPTDTFCSSYAPDGNMTYDPQQVCSEGEEQPGADVRGPRKNAISGSPFPGPASPRWLF